MKSLARKIIVGLMAGSLFFVGASEISAAENQPPKPPTQEQMQARINAWVKHTASWSGVSEKDLLDAVKNHRSIEDIDYAAMLSRISKKSFKDVLAMKTDWSDVMKKLGITPEKYKSAVEEIEIEEVSKEAGIDTATVKSLLEKHYHPRDIIIAGKLAKASGKNIQEVLDMKKINQRWRDVAEDLKLDKKISEETERQENEEEEPPPQE